MNSENPAMVVCVAADWTPLPGDRSPQLNEVLTIREAFTYDGQVFLRFVEIVNPRHEVPPIGACEDAWCSTRFRPVAKTNIASLEALLQPLTDSTVPA